MPKPKPSQIIRHEIALTRNLQETVDTLAMTKSFDNMVRPVAIGAGVAGLGLLSYAAYKGLKAYFNWGTDAIDDLTAAVTVHAAMKEVAKYEGKTKEEVAEEFTAAEIKATADQLRSSKSKFANSPAGRFGRFVNNLF
tara:strand:- start:766 stop:1179 length:414 start_codon:yes stop_codon:yes gene_type:complete